MKIAFVHYHLNPGGVTTVIRQQVNAVKNTSGDAIVLTGSASPTPFPAETIVVEGLGYSQAPENTVKANTISDKIIRAVRKKWPSGCDLIHVHNPTLAKNPNLPPVLGALQKQGFRLLLQIHDFAEDGRPDVYSHAPYIKDCHYGVINTRDYQALLTAGLETKGLHLLPNMVTPLETGVGTSSQKPFVLYPVRAIRRKNIGEALLLSLFFGTDHHLAITLPPTSPVDVVAYDHWRLFAGQHQLPVHFEAGLHNDFLGLAAGADYFLTTSINEGFGFSFLEPWTAGKSLQGRKLPDICRDFESNGIGLENLYPSLNIPSGWIDQDSYLGSWRKAVEKAGRQFAYPLSDSVLSNARSGLSKSPTIDFGLLNEKYQREVLRRLAATPEEKAVLKKLNPVLETIANPPDIKSRIHGNRENVFKYYNSTMYEKALQKTYERVAHTTVSQEIRKDILLSRFFNFDRFSLLKWGDYEQ